MRTRPTLTPRWHDVRINFHIALVGIGLGWFVVKEIKRKLMNKRTRCKQDTDLEKYLAEEARFWEDRQNNEAFAKADKEERERQAMEVVGRAYKMLTSKQFGFSGNEAAEVILECPLLEKRGFTSDEARSLVASYLETAQ